MEGHPPAWAQSGGFGQVEALVGAKQEVARGRPGLRDLGGDAHAHRDPGAHRGIAVGQLEPGHPLGYLPLEREAGHLECLGRGPDARWQKLDEVGTVPNN